MTRRKRSRLGRLVGAAMVTCLGLAGEGNGAPFPEGALTGASRWDDPAFLAGFRATAIPSRIAHRPWPDPGVVLGRVPHSVIGRFDGDRLRSITVLMLDSGTHFGYVPRTEADTVEKENREAFQALYATTATETRAALAKLAGGSGSLPLELGTEPMLRQTVFLYSSGDLYARLHVVEEQLVKVTVFRDEADARNWIDPAERERKDRDRLADYGKRTERRENGDVLLSDIPLLPQGDRAYCGVSALSMTMQYLGLNLDTEDYAAASGIRYGSTKGSQIRETYDAAAAEAGFRLSRATKFDFKKAKESIDNGIPVLVWRRWNQERDYLHTQFAATSAKSGFQRLDHTTTQVGVIGLQANPILNHRQVLATVLVDSSIPLGGQ